VESIEQRRQHYRRGARHRSDTQRAATQSETYVDLFDREIGLLREMRGIREQCLAEGRQLHTRGAALEQVNAQLALHLLHDAAERGLRQVQLLRCAAEAAGVHDRQKSP
jgi:hypothetical protein